MPESPDDPFFLGVSPEPVSTSAGPCPLPILYFDASLLMLVYSVDPALARPFVDARGFEPLVLFGKAWAVFAAFEYRESTIGPYGEVGVGVLSKRVGTSPSLLGLVRDQRKEKNAGIYVTNLPVTTTSARAAGFELWGFPKYVTGIETTFRKDGIRVVLEREVLVTMSRGLSVKTRGLPLVLFSVNEARRVLRTIVETDSVVEWGGAGSVGVKILGDGPTAQTMRGLRMDVRQPVAAYCTDRLRSILPRGEDAGAAFGSARPAGRAPSATAEAARLQD
jgi:hypothetical protein